MKYYRKILVEVTIEATNSKSANETWRGIARRIKNGTNFSSVFTENQIESAKGIPNKKRRIIF